MLKTPTGDVQARREPPGDRHHASSPRWRRTRRASFYNKVLRKVDNVNQMLGMKKEEFQDRLARRAELPVTLTRPRVARDRPEWHRMRTATARNAARFG